VELKQNAVFDGYSTVGKLLQYKWHHAFAKLHRLQYISQSERRPTRSIFFAIYLKPYEMQSNSNYLQKHKPWPHTRHAVNGG